MHRMQIIRKATAALLAVTALPGFGQTSDETLGLVYVGDSWLQPGLQQFAAAASDDLGVPVEIIQRNSNLVAFATKRLKSGQWNAVEDADIVLIQMSGNFGRRSGFCLDTVAEFAYSQTPEALRAETDAFFAELVKFVDPAEAMIRVTIWGVPPSFRAWWEERGVVDECAGGWVSLMQQWKEPAAQYGIAVIDLATAWNGQDGIAETPASLFRSDGYYLSDAGIASVVAQIRARGYAPLAP